MEDRLSSHGWKVPAISRARPRPGAGPNLLRTIPLAGLLAALFLSAPAVWSTAPPALSARARPPIAVLILTPDLGFKQLAAAAVPALEALAQEGAPGMLNVRTVRGGSVDEGFLSIGAGSRASASFAGEIGQSFNRSERFEGAPAAAVYHRRTALNPQQFGVLALNYAQIRADSAAAPYQLEPGLLGDLLRSAAIRTAVLGNGDLPAGSAGQSVVFHREVVGAAMDHLGRVYQGDVSEQLLQRDVLSPFSVHLNTARLLSEFDRLASHCRFIAIEDGDFLGLHATAPLYTGPAYRAEESAALVRADQLVGAIRQRLNPARDLLIFCAPAIESVAGSQTMLAPIVADGPGFNHPLAPGSSSGAARQGPWLWSPSTRRAGLGVLTDLTPTILRFFDLPAPATIPGSPLSSTQADRHAGAGVLWSLSADNGSKLQAVGGLEGRLEKADRIRDDVERWYVYLIPILLLAGAAARALDSWPLARKSRLAEWGFQFPVALPLAMLITPYLRPPNSLIAALEVAVLAAVLVLAAQRLARPGFGPVPLIGAVTALAVAADLLLGQQSMIFSMLSYSATEGARYYGIGNEYMGVLLGASLTALCMAAGRFWWSRAGVAAALFVPAVIICLPSIGAKAGGALVAVPAAAVAGWVLLGGRVRGRTIAVLALLGVAALAALAFWDAHSHSMTHIGKAAEGIRAGGPGELLNIISRKSLMEWRLLKYSPWSRALLGAIAAALSLFFSRRRAWKQMCGGTAAVGLHATDTRTTNSAAANSAERVAAAPVRAALWGVAAAAATGLLFNDAGVLAAALAFLWFPALAAERLRSVEPDPAYLPENGSGR